MKNRDSRAASAPPKTLQLKVTLRHVQPPIWRRLAVGNDLTLDDLHLLIQKTMGWDNDHMHAFYIGGVEYAHDETARSCGVLCDEDFPLHQVIKRRGQRFTYEYDFGDRWMHDILVEKTEPCQGEPPPPRCLDGARACPRENSGGVYGYQLMLEVKSNPSLKHRLADWGDPSWVLNYNPEHFDLDAVNRRPIPVGP
jgi:hypothetical protein